MTPWPIFSEVKIPKTPATLYIDKYINQDRLSISLSRDSKEKNGQKTSSAVARLEPTTLRSVFANAQALLSCVLTALHQRPGKVAG